MTRGSVLLAVMFVCATAFAQRRRALPNIPIPAENAASLAHPSTRPSTTTAEAAARRIFNAIVADTPNTVHDTFFPRDPFLVLKGIDDPGHYHEVLLRHFDRDIHALHTELTRRGTPTFDRFQFSTRATWQAIRSEANALPYWAVRHSVVHYRVGNSRGEFEIKVFINWGTTWYVTHLS